MQKKYFYIGLILFFLIAFLSPNKITYFGAYLVCTFFFYLASKKITESLIYSLILSLFFDTSIGASLFAMQPSEWNLGSGYAITPTTLILLSLIPFSFNKSFSKLKAPDIIIAVFYCISVFNVFLFPYPNAFFGLIGISEFVLLYYILRIHLKEKQFDFIKIILISLLCFQITVATIQIVRGSSAGFLVESSNADRPYGYTASEDQNIFRVTGTFGHPNFLASFLLIGASFVLFSPSSSILYLGLGALDLAVLIFTSSRAAWFIFMLIVAFWIWYQLKILKESNIFRTTLTLFILIIVLLIPFIITRLDTLPQAFDPNGSVDVRYQLNNEAINIISKNPITGVGLNRAIEFYSTFFSPSDPLSEIQGSFFKIHNTILEISTEIGIFGGITYLVFFFIVFKTGLKFIPKKNNFKIAATMGLFGVFCISLFNPFFHTPQMRYLFLLSSFIMI